MVGTGDMKWADQVVEMVERMEAQVVLLMAVKTQG